MLFSKAVTPEESKAFEAFAKPLIEQCQKDFGMDKESFAQKNLDEIDECLIACVVEKFGIVSRIRTLYVLYCFEDN